jgi:hypothetical protein
VVTPSPNLAGWHNTTPVQVSFTVVDAGSGVASMKVTRSDVPGIVATNCAGPFSFTSETPVSGTTITCEAINGAGTPNSVTVTVKIDKTAPGATITSPINGATYVEGSSITASYSCSDGLSGVAVCSGPVANGSSFNAGSPGAKTFTVNATDVAGNPGSQVNNYNVVTSTAGGALSFDGVADHVNIPRNAPLNLSTFTLETWVKLDTLVTTRQPLISKGLNFGNYALSILPVSGQSYGIVDYVQSTGAGNYSCNSGSTQVPFGQWTHVAAVVSSPVVKIFVNGQLAATCGGAPATITNNVDLLLGRTNLSPSTYQFLRGELDEVRIWNVARTDAQISGSYNRFVTSNPSLVGYWKFDEAADSQMVNDSSGTNHGTLGNNKAINPDDPARVVSKAPIIIVP